MKNKINNKLTTEELYKLTPEELDKLTLEELETISGLSLRKAEAEMMNKPRTWADVQEAAERGKQDAYVNIFFIVMILLIIGAIFSLFSKGNSPSSNYEVDNGQPMCGEYWCK